MNVVESFLCLIADFLNYKVRVTPFRYIGLPVGANPRRASTWQPMIDALEKRLGSWKNKYCPGVVGLCSLTRSLIVFQFISCLL